jgi:hypothetical protein
VLHSSGALIRAAMIKSAVGRAVRGFVGHNALAVPKVRTKLTGQLSGIGYTYPAPDGAHELVGTRAEDIPLAGGGRLYEALRGGQFVLVGDVDVTGWADRVTVAAPAEPTGVVMLVRPDGYVGWAGTDVTELHRVLADLVGPPAASDIG